MGFLASIQNNKKRRYKKMLKSQRQKKYETNGHHPRWHITNRLYVPKTAETVFPTCFYAL